MTDIKSDSAQSMTPYAAAGPKDDVDEPIMMLAFSDIRQSTV